ncbi:MULTISPECIES: hypothetical protein [unclassified Myxococcus]|uniref:hypothetical protein n=2 Tax=Myxococcaceae TaxID=31 RepID=UPI001CBE3805|nr:MULTISPECIES: hypothetical protein [unclassified Myxococcus]MBZ4396782.1 hypothetical protein [Myxococcus sp. AS-1-15]MBZ4408493.1 hypothetical protein [Myxococcus sp. XM-1-1-1]BDT33592.1 DUF6055 domain-containing protein [Myxococcus sp. MH1]
MRGQGRAGLFVVGAALMAMLAGCQAPRRSTVDISPAAAPGALAKTTALPTSSGARITLEFQPRDTAAADQVRLAVERALPRMARWGTFDDSVSIIIHPNHAALERAANRPNHDFLRAWARYEQIELQSPRTWTLLGASQSQVDELLLHELTHSLMYQVASDRLGWTRKRIPLWFREGMASYTAEQGYRTASLEDLARYYGLHPQADPLAQADSLYRRESDIVYSAAHHAFTFLVRRYGEPVARGVLRVMSQGPDFPEAFAQAVGLSQEAFLRDFRRYVQWRGFKGGRLLRPYSFPTPDHLTLPPPPSL